MQKAFVFFWIVLFAISGLQHQHSTAKLYDGSPKTKNNPKAFLEGIEYIFDYNSQIAIGLTSADVSSELQQKAMIRMQAQVKMKFHSDLNASLHLQNIQVPKINICQSWKEN